MHDHSVDILKPGGQPIGVPGASPDIREVPGGVPAARSMFDELAKGAKDVTPRGYPGTMVEPPAGGRIGLRPASKSGAPTIDVNLPTVPEIKKIKFK